MTSTPVAPHQASAATTDGRGPTGMWWVAWRQHRTLVLVELVLMTIAVAALVAFRLMFQAYEQTWGRQSFETARTLLRIGMVALPAVVGIFAGASMFARECERRTDVFALTQSVGRNRWYWTKCVVVSVPLIAGMAIVGLTTRWAEDVYGPEMWPFDPPTFQISGLIPASLTAMVLGISFGVGVFARSALPAAAVTLVLSIAAVGGIGYLGYQDLAPSDRVVGAPSENTYDRVPAGAIALDEGYLGADGEPHAGGACPDAVNWVDDFDDRYAVCLQAQGITGRYTDYVYGSYLTPALAVVSLLLAGAFLTAGSIRIRRRTT